MTEQKRIQNHFVNFSDTINRLKCFVSNISNKNKVYLFWKKETKNWKNDVKT